MSRRYRLFDSATAEKLSTVHAYAVEHGLRLCVDFDGARIPGAWWVIQIYDEAETTLLSARGKDLAEAVSELHERWLAKNGRHC